MNVRKVKRLRRMIQGRHFYEKRYDYWNGEWHLLFNLSPSYRELIDWEEEERWAQRIRAQMRWYKRKLSIASQR